MQDTAQTSAAGNSGLVDALPYYDTGYEEPGVRQAVSETISFIFICEF